VHTAEEIIDAEPGHQYGRKGENRRQIKKPYAVPLLYQSQVKDYGISNHGD